MHALLAIISDDPDTADLCFAVAWLALWIVGIILIVQRAVMSGIAWVAVGFIPLGYLFLTP